MQLSETVMIISELNRVAEYNSRLDSPFEIFGSYILYLSGMKCFPNERTFVLDCLIHATPIRYGRMHGIPLDISNVTTGCPKCSVVTPRLTPTPAQITSAARFFQPLTIVPMAAGWTSSGPPTSLLVAGFWLFSRLLLNIIR